MKTPESDISFICENGTFLGFGIYLYYGTKGLIMVAGSAEMV